jgi:hypothetical protein
MVLSRVAVGDRLRGILGLRAHIGLGHVLEEFPGDEGHEKRHAGGARGTGELVPFAFVHQPQHLHHPAFGDDDRHTDQHGDANASRHHVGQLGRTACRRLAFELRVEAPHERLHERLEDQDTDDEIER